MQNANSLQKYKRRMKRHPTRSERIFAERLRAARFEFKSQCIVGFYIVDFVIPSRMLVIEVDGASHVGREHYDRQRDEFLKACGFDVVHVQNGDVTAVDFGFIRRRDERYDEREFRRALAIANNLRSVAVRSLNGVAAMHG